MGSFSKVLYRWSSWRSVLAITLLYGFFLNQVMAPHAAEMQRFAGAWGAPDGHFFYTPTELYSHISTWDDDGRKHYVRFRLGLDPLWALIYSSFLITLGSVALRSATTEDDSRRLLNLVPLIPMSCDLLENGLGIGLVSALPMRLNWLAAIMGATSLVKWTSLAIAHLLLLYSLAIAVRRMAQAR